MLSIVVPAPRGAVDRSQRAQPAAQGFFEGVEVTVVDERSTDAMPVIVAGLGRVSGATRSAGRSAAGRLGG